MLSMNRMISEYNWVQVVILCMLLLQVHNAVMAARKSFDFFLMWSHSSGHLSTSVATCIQSCERSRFFFLRHSNFSCCFCIWFLELLPSSVQRTCHWTIRTFVVYCCWFTGAAICSWRCTWCVWNSPSRSSTGKTDKVHACDSSHITKRSSSWFWCYSTNEYETSSCRCHAMGSLAGPCCGKWFVTYCRKQVFFS